jgi:hypothetical protein
MQQQAISSELKKIFAHGLKNVRNQGGLEETSHNG